MLVNLGSSDRHFDGYINVDICEPADITADLRERWPFSDSTVAEFRCWDILEHLPDRIHSFNELYRCLKPGGRADIIVPTTDGRGAWQDLTHVSYFNRNVFFYVEDGNPHLTRFSKAYGVNCKFRILYDKEEMLADKVSKLQIILEAVK